MSNTDAEAVFTRLMDITNKKVVAKFGDAIKDDKEAFGKAYAELFPVVMDRFCTNLVNKHGQKKVGVLIKQLRDTRLHAKVYASI